MVILGKVRLPIFPTFEAMKQLLIITATPFEVAGLQAHLRQHYTCSDTGIYQHGNVQVQLACTGIGLVSTTYRLTRLLHQYQPDLVLQLGIAGVLEPGMPLGSLVRVQDDCLADLGARTPEGLLLHLEDMGLEDSSAGLLPASDLPEWLPLVASLPAAMGLSVNQISGQPDDARQYVHPDRAYSCHVESMEGAALHYVCREMQQACVQIRALSNYIEPRNKDNWQLKTAIDKLNSFAISVLDNIA